MLCLHRTKFLVTMEGLGDKYSYVDNLPVEGTVDGEGQCVSSVTYRATTLPIDDGRTRGGMPERCRFWPNCKNGDSCPYLHPKTPCRFDRANTHNVYGYNNFTDCFLTANMATNAVLYTLNANLMQGELYTTHVLHIYYGTTVGVQNPTVHICTLYGDPKPYLPQVK